jgi:hypothetical protein
VPWPQREFISGRIRELTQPSSSAPIT